MQENLSRKSTFLDAQWRKLLMANYEVSPEILKKYLPYKTELDFWNNRCYVSLVGFLFIETKVLGIKFPFHTNFEEVNLRFYVRYHDNGIWKRGVVFIKEIVPKYMITLVANTVYNENYATHPCKHEISESESEIAVKYYWKSGSGWNYLQAKANNQCQAMVSGSEEEFITEHYWGYAKYADTKTNEYEVKHPRWDVYPVKDYQIQCNFGELYGQDFAFLKEAAPTSVLLAEGSEISVLRGKTIN
ncbi:YqjF family protein [Emticicia sp. 17c]|uniref:YqjF family protein n=1 Tax=Emticicia sp. 17c TaxID=3127704 RepID=UPI00301DB9C3